jgi:Arylsulfotransferase (ASST)
LERFGKEDGVRRIAPRALLGFAFASAALLLWLPAHAPGAGSPVVVYPIPGARVASPQTQITFRGMLASQLGSIVATGSRSGVHAGRVRADSDGRGGSFVPATRFVPGETVTVSTSLNVVGGTGGSFRFTVANPAGALPSTHWPPPASRTRGDVQRFHSRPDLAPAQLTLRVGGRTAPGDIFLPPQFGPVQDGPMIVDAGGHLVWFDRLHGNASAADFRVQTYRAQPVLTWWRGFVTAGVGVGEDVIMDRSYRTVAVVHAGNGLAADLHEFQLTGRGTALVTAYYPVYWDASAVHRSRREIVLDAVVQEIDIPTGLVLFQWDSLDHVPVTAAYAPPPKSVRSPFDYFTSTRLIRTKTATS